jgi:hypothetical protein
MNSDELRELVLSRRAEVLAILLMDAAEQWARAHIEVAKSDADIQRLKAEMLWLETVISHERSRTKAAEPVPECAGTGPAV